MPSVMSKGVGPPTRHRVMINDPSHYSSADKKDEVRPIDDPPHYSSRTKKGIVINDTLSYSTRLKKDLYSKVQTQVKGLNVPMVHVRKDS